MSNKMHISLAFAVLALPWIGVHADATTSRAPAVQVVSEEQALAAEIPEIQLAPPSREQIEALTKLPDTPFVAAEEPDQSQDAPVLLFSDEDLDVKLPPVDLTELMKVPTTEYVAAEDPAPTEAPAVTPKPEETAQPTVAQKPEEVKPEEVKPHEEPNVRHHRHAHSEDVACHRDDQSNQFAQIQSQIALMQQTMQAELGLIQMLSMQSEITRGLNYFSSAYQPNMYAMGFPSPVASLMQSLQQGNPFMNLWQQNPTQPMLNMTNNYYGGQVYQTPIAPMGEQGLPQTLYSPNPASMFPTQFGPGQPGMVNFGDSSPGMIIPQVAPQTLPQLTYI